MVVAARAPGEQRRRPVEGGVGRAQGGHASGQHVPGYRAQCLSRVRQVRETKLQCWGQHPGGASQARGAAGHENHSRSMGVGGVGVSGAAAGVDAGAGAGAGAEAATGVAVDDGGGCEAAGTTRTTLAAGAWSVRASMSTRRRTEGSAARSGWARLSAPASVSWPAPASASMLIGLRRAGWWWWWWWCACKGSGRERVGWAALPPFNPSQAEPRGGPAGAARAKKKAGGLATAHEPGSRSRPAAQAMEMKHFI